MQEKIPVTFDKETEVEIPVVHAEASAEQSSAQRLDQTLGPTSPEEQFSVVELNSDLWHKYRAIRLQALKTDPQVFGESIQREPDKDEPYWRGKLEQPGVKMYAVEKGGKIVATAGLQEKPDGRFLLGRVYVDPEHRGKGFAKLLIDKVFIEAKNAGAKSIGLDVVAEQAFAVGLYKSLGFEEVGRKNEVKGDGKHHDEILMEKKLE